jgi:hypothetical protein
MIEVTCGGRIQAPHWQGRVIEMERAEQASSKVLGCCRWMKPTKADTLQTCPRFSLRARPRRRFWLRPLSRTLSASGLLWYGPGLRQSGGPETNILALGLGLCTALPLRSPTLHSTEALMMAERGSSCVAERRTPRYATQGPAWTTSSVFFPRRLSQTP